MLGLAWPVCVELGDRCGRIEERTQRQTESLRRRELLRQITDPNWATVLAVVGERIVWWLSAMVRSLSRIGVRRSDVRYGSRRGRVVTGAGVMTDRGGGWLGSWMRGADSRDRRGPLLDAQACFVGADGASLKALAEGPAVTANRQTLRNRELGQLCQTQKWLKRYKTGMFANLANLAKQICEMVRWSRGSESVLCRPKSASAFASTMRLCGGQTRQNTDVDQCRSSLIRGKKWAKRDKTGMLVNVAQT